MASTFLERNKQQAQERAAAPAAPTWKRRGAGPLAGLTLAAMGLFLAPPDITAALARACSGMPVVGPWAAHYAEISTPESKAHSFAQLMEALKTARLAGNPSKWSLFSRGSGDGMSMIRGSQAEVLGPVTAKVAGGTTISGILSPEEARRAGKHGVALSAEEAQRAAAVLSGGKLTAAQSEDEAKKTGSAAKVPAKEKEKSVDDRERDHTPIEFRHAIKDNEASRPWHPGQGGAPVDVSAPGSALSSLTEARTQGMIAGRCVGSHGCKKETAVTHASSVYDGNHVGEKAGRALEAPPVAGLDAASRATGPTNGDKEDFQGEVEQIKKSQAACIDADARFKPSLSEHEARYAQLSMQPVTPQSMMELSRECRMIDEIKHQWYDACPLRSEDGPYEAMKCD